MKAYTLGDGKAAETLAKIVSGNRLLSANISRKFGDYCHQLREASVIKDPKVRARVLWLLTVDRMTERPSQTLAGDAWTFFKNIVSARYKKMVRT